MNKLLRAQASSLSRPIFPLLPRQFASSRPCPSDPRQPVNRNPKNAVLRQKMETSEQRYLALNASLKDELVKEKIARDVLLEESTITFLVAQQLIFKVTHHRVCKKKHQSHPHTECGV